MSEQPLLPLVVPTAAATRRAERVEYIDFTDLDGHREYRFRIYGTEGSREVRMSIANASFAARSVRRQDGAEVCYRKLLRMVAAVETPYADVIAIEDGDLFRYRDDHTPVPKRRSPPPPSPVAPVSERPKRPPYRPRAPRVTSPTLPAAAVPEAVGPSFEEGQRVNHAVFGAGVTTASTSAHTVVAFDRDGSKRFVTSLLELEVLSAPGTWETGPRGANRPCRTP